MSQQAPATRSRVLAWVVTVAITVPLALSLSSTAIGLHAYGWGLFVGVPYVLGFLCSVVLSFQGPRPLSSCLRVTAMSLMGLALGFLVFGLEGLICIAMAAVIGVPIALLGAWMGYIILARKFLPPVGTALVLVAGVAASLWAEGKYPREAPVFTVTDSTTISASPAVVWTSLITMESLGQPKDFLFHVGIACPQRVDIYGTGVGAWRVCTLTTGQLHEHITVWEPGRLLRWTSVSTPPPLKELNPFADVDPPHLHGFYRSVGGQFELEALASGETRVTRSSSYRHGLFPAGYWRIWSDYVASRGHIHVLEVLKQSAEASAVASR